MKKVLLLVLLIAQQGFAAEIECAEFGLSGNENGIKYISTARIVDLKKQNSGNTNLLFGAWSDDDQYVSVALPKSFESLESQSVVEVYTSLEDVTTTAKPIGKKHTCVVLPTHTIQNQEMYVRKDERKYLGDKVFSLLGKYSGDSSCTVDVKVNIKTANRFEIILSTASDSFGILDVSNGSTVKSIHQAVTNKTSEALVETERDGVRTRMSLQFNSAGKLIQVKAQKRNLYLGVPSPLSSSITCSGLIR